MSECKITVVIYKHCCACIALFRKKKRIIPINPGVRDSVWSTDTTFFKTPLFFFPFTLYGSLHIDPVLHEAHIGGLTVRSRLGRIRKVHRSTIFL